MRAAGDAWEDAARRRHQRRQWPPPRDERSKAIVEKLREHALGRSHSLRPYLILLAVLAIALILFAALASRHGAAEAEPQSARPTPTWEEFDRA